MEDNLQNSNMPQEGTTEYEQMMREAYGEEFEYQKRATFLPRFFATIIDGLISSLIGMFLILVVFDLNIFDFNYLRSLLLNQDKELMESLGLKMAFLSFGMTALFMVFEIIFATSPGKLLLDLKIANSDSSNASFQQLLIRSIFKHSPELLSILLAIASIQSPVFSIIHFLMSLTILIGFLFALSDKRQALQDIVAKTAVYKTSNLNLEN